MKKVVKQSIMGILTAALLAGLVTSCDSDADVVAGNISKAAEQFEIQRRIVFFNGITDKYLLEIQGLCSVETSESALGGSLEVTCKTGPDSYKKHFLGLSDNVSFFVEQMEPVSASAYHYRVIFKPSVIVPDVEMP